MPCKHETVLETEEARQKMLGLLRAKKMWPEDEIVEVAESLDIAFGQCAECNEFVAHRKVHDA